MRVLIACERSGVVRRAFRDRGHDAWSCDIEAADDGDPHHLRGDASKVLGGKMEPGYMNWITVPWDLLIAFPPCTRLTRAGARWWPKFQGEQQEALEFVRQLLAAPIERIALENPPGKIGTAIRKADQYVQPWMFGHPEKKETGLWLKNLPKLVPTKDVHAHMLTLPKKDQNRVHYMAPGPERGRLRSETYPGIAAAMADQWGGLPST